jgi:hypothetical protein
MRPAGEAGRNGRGMTGGQPTPSAARWGRSRRAQALLDGALDCVRAGGDPAGVARSLFDALHDEHLIPGAEGFEALAAYWPAVRSMRGDAS